MTNPLHVFLAEDNPGDIELVHEALRENEVEYTMTIARDGAQAKRYIESIGTNDAPCPDVLILDLNLPKADGHELLALLRSRPLCTETPVIVVTSSNSRKDRDRAAALGVRVVRTEDWSIRELALDARGSRFRLSGERDLRIHCPLAGAHQVENAVTAAVALARLGVPAAAIEAGIARTEWPGRLERVTESPEIILDGAHNPAGARALAAYIQRFYSGRPVRLIYGAMRDKAIEEISGILFPRAQQVIVTAPRQARALSPEAIHRISDHPNLVTAPDIEAALELVRGAGPEDVIFVTGSLFLVAEARALLVG